MSQPFAFSGDLDVVHELYEVFWRLDEFKDSWLTSAESDFVRGLAQRAQVKFFPSPFGNRLHDSVRGFLLYVLDHDSLDADLSQSSVVAADFIRREMNEERGSVALSVRRRADGQLACVARCQWLLPNDVSLDKVFEKWSPQGDWKRLTFTAPAEFIKSL